MGVGVPEMESVAISNLLRDCQSPFPEPATEEQAIFRSWIPRIPLAILECSLSRAKNRVLDDVSDATLRRKEVVPIIIQAFAPLLISTTPAPSRHATRTTFEHGGILKHSGLLMDVLLAAMESSPLPKEVSSARVRQVHDTMAHTLEVALRAMRSDHESLLLMVPEFVSRNGRIEQFHPRPYTPQPHHAQRFERLASLVSSPSPRTSRPKP